MVPTCRRNGGCEDAAWHLIEAFCKDRAGDGAAAADSALELQCGPAGLTLLAHTGDGEKLALHLDFVRGRQGYRLARATHSREDLVRAMGNLPRDSRILDASGGLGRDAMILAARGFRVTMLERHLLLAALLSDGLRRAARHEPLRPTLQRLEFVCGDAQYWLATQKIPIDAAVFDPMFPSRTKDAAVKKEMRILQYLLGDQADLDAPQTLATLLRHVRHRVVVKRPLHAPALTGPRPSYALSGRSTRFDVYLPVISGWCGSETGSCDAQ